LTDPRREEADRMIRTVSIALMVAATSVAAAPPAAAQDAL
jgi:hypothetical protein